MDNIVKVLFALCAVVGLLALLAALEDRSRWPMWGIFVSMMLSAVSMHPRVRELGRRDDRRR